MFYCKIKSVQAVLCFLYLISFMLAILTEECNCKTLPAIFDYPQSDTTPATTITTTPQAEKTRDIVIGPCVWAIGRTCPDKEVRFYLYTRKNLKDRQCLHIDESLEKSNLTASNFNPNHMTKIIIHGYNADMFLSPLYKMREEYLAKQEYNIIYVDWAILSPGPCYLSAVHNTKHVGACVAQLVERILDTGSTNMHIIGFSLGAQLANYVARNLETFQLPRITGLDPAMPLFITASKSEKLDPSDAAFVDVIHTNALVQGKLEQCGHVDFYMNGGIMQPGCYTQDTNPFACSHQRAPVYFLESIRTRKGFWGWSCSSYIAYLLGMCPPTNYLMEAGENLKYSTRGMYLVNTNDTSPYALGKWTNLPMLGVKRPFASQSITITAPIPKGHPLLRQIDQWGKLDYNFNNLEYVDLPDSSGEITSNEVKDVSVEEQELEDLSNASEVEWNEYRKNLTAGFMDSSIFQVPKIKQR